MNLTLNSNDEVVMKLLHYFITIKGYNPVILHGAKNEIWLENSDVDADYKIIRIVSNYIHNDEQLHFDIYRAQQILKRIKRKMFSFKMNTLSIFVNLGENVNLNNNGFNNIKCAEVKSMNDLSKYSFIINSFPNILEVESDQEKGLELFIKLTNDINKKNLEESKRAEDVFTPKKPIVTYILLALCVIFYLIPAFIGGDLLEIKPGILGNFGGLVNFNMMGRNYTEFVRLIISIFLHGNILHLLCNCYSLYILGPQIESFFGKVKFTIIFLLSGVIGNLVTMLFLQNNVVSIGASGAIFGLLGSILYFGYHYRVYLSTTIKSRIIPIIVLNLVIGSMSSSINNFAHIGGLIGGFLASKAVGVKYKSKKADIINGIIMIGILISFLFYMIVSK